MQNWQLTSPTRDFVPIDELDRHVSCWLLDCEISSHSPATIAWRYDRTRPLPRLLREQGAQPLQFVVLHPPLILMHHRSK